MSDVNESDSQKLISACGKRASSVQPWPAFNVGPFQVFRQSPGFNTILMVAVRPVSVGSHWLAFAGLHWLTCVA